jgi:hypothetical protein
MRICSTALCYIIPEGSTQEETCTWEELEERVRQGHLTLKTRLYDPDAKEWVQLDSMEEFEGIEIASVGVEGAEDGEELRGGSEELAEEYEEAKRQLREMGASPDLILKAGRAALNLGRREEAGGYFQRALELNPYNQRIAGEIKRSFSPVVYRTFRLLDRKPPFWEDPLRAVAFARGNGWKWYALVTPAVSLLRFIPWAEPIYWTVFALLGVHAARECGRGAPRPFPTDGASARALLGSAGPLGGFALAGAEFLAACLAIAAVATVLGGDVRWNVFASVANSPLLEVGIFTLGAIYLPAVLMASANVRLRLAECGDPRRIFGIMKAMETEYVMSAIGMAAVAVAWLVLRMVLSPVPVAGEVIATGAGLFGVAIIGYLAGHAVSRHAQIFGPPADDGASDPE